MESRVAFEEEAGKIQITRNMRSRSFPNHYFLIIFQLDISCKSYMN